MLFRQITKLSAGWWWLLPIINALDSLNLEYPKVSKEKLAELNAVKKELLAEK